MYFTVHAQERMEERGITRKQVYAALDSEIRREPGRGGVVKIYGAAYGSRLLKIFADGDDIITVAWYGNSEFTESPKQDAILDVLEPLFAGCDELDSDYVLRNLYDAGCSLTSVTLWKARKRMGLRANGVKWYRADSIPAVTTGALCA